MAVDESIDITKNISIVNTQNNLTITSMTNLPVLFSILPQKEVYFQGFTIQAANFPNNYIIQNSENITLKNVELINFSGQKKNTLNMTVGTINIKGILNIHSN